MSSGIYPAFERETEAQTSARSGRALSHNYEVLEVAAGALGIVPLSAFIDNRSMLETLLDPEEKTTFDWPETVWFNAQDGINTIQALDNHLQSYTNLPLHAETLLDLLELKRALIIAAQSNVRFHLLVDV